MIKKSTQKLFMSSITLLLSCLLLSCCSGEGNEPSATGQTSETIDWKTEGFTVSGEVEKNQKLWVAEYIPWKHEDMVVADGKETLYLSHISSRAYGSKMYQLYAVPDPSSQHHQASEWYLEIYDVEAMSSSVREFSYEQLGEERNNSLYGFLRAMDLGEESLIFEWMEMETDSKGRLLPAASRMIYLNPEGDLHKTDLMGFYQEKGLIQDTWPDTCWDCDGTGNTYHRAIQSGYGYTQLYVMDREGAVLLEYIGTQEQGIGNPMRTESGELIYPVYDKKDSCYYFMWPDTETGEMRTLGSIDEPWQQIKQLYGMQGSILYYETPEGIIAWDIKSRIRTLIFDYQKNGISTNYQTMLVFLESRMPILRLYHKDNFDNYGNNTYGEDDWLALLSEEPVQREETLRVADLVDSGLGSRQVRECCALTSRKDMNQTILFQKADADMDADTFRMRIMAELATGNGPDILYVSRSDMALLYELGVLADLRDLVPRATLDDLWPAAVSMGTLDGKLAGLPPSIEGADSLVVSRDTWGKDSWELEDIIALMDEGRLYNAVYYNVYLPNENFWFQPLGATNVLVGNCLEGSFLIDWEKRECHFEDERFVHLLELLKGSSDYLSDDTDGWSHGGKSVAGVNFVNYKNVDDFDVLVDRENGHYVGYPTYGNSGNYFENSGVLVVNANIKDREKIEAFLEYLLGDNIQKICEIITPDMPLDLSYTAFTVRRYHIEDIELTPEGEYIWHNVKLSVMEDGTTSLHRAIAFLESCVPAPAVYPDIRKIMDEELDAYYSSDRSARETAEIIDRRVQIYLDENN